MNAISNLNNENMTENFLRNIFMILLRFEKLNSVDIFFAQFSFV